MNKKIILLTIIILILGIGLVYGKKLYNKPTPAPAEQTKQPVSISPNDPPQIVSTNPSPLEDNIVSSNQTIEITFNRPLQNSGEFKLRIEPKIVFKIDLSSDRKTAKISFPKLLELGVTYTISIGPETKFDGMGNWNQDKMYHFKTVKYTGV